MSSFLAARLLCGKPLQVSKLHPVTQVAKSPCLASVCLRGIKTTKKSTDTIAIKHDSKTETAEKEEEEDKDYNIVKWRFDGKWHISKNPKDWVSFGYHPWDAVDDRWNHRLSMFLTVSFGLFTAFVCWFRPDVLHERDWVTREAYLELARRERYGLPVIDPDYIPKEKILSQLPPEEELVGKRVII